MSPNFNEMSQRQNYTDYGDYYYGNNYSNGNYYENSLNQVDVIEVEKGKVIKIEFSAFDVENAGASCPWDHLSMVDGDGTVLLNKACGVKEPFTICSRTNVVYFTFVTDCIYGRPGWRAEWNSETECSAAATAVKPLVNPFLFMAL